MKGLSFRLILLFSFGFPLLLALSSVLTGSIPFWFDPGRDLMLASDNLHKLSLIGPPSGIPGFFYGPYWIWLLSLGMLFSRDPKIIAIIVLTIPYFVIFPFALYKLSQLLDKTTAILLWLLFILNCIQYATQLWNPHLSPLLSLVFFYLLVSTNYTKAQKSDYVKILGAGITVGLLLNFHMSFAIGVTLGSLVFLLTQYFFILKKKIIDKRIVLNCLFGIFLFCTGVAAVQLPFFIFEMRHGFQQIHTAITTLTSSGAVVGLIGLSKQQIVTNFFAAGGKVLGIPKVLNILAIILIATLFGQILKQRKASLQAKDKTFLTLLGCISMGVLTVYLTSKNPVWDYHFISIEILFLLLIGFISSKLPYFQKALSVWVIVLVLFNFNGFVKSVGSNPYNIPSLITKEHIIDIIVQDPRGSQGSNYTVFIYSPFIYTYDFSYIFSWRANKGVPYDPGRIPMNTRLVYLIIPESSKKVREDFINYRTPNKSYKTTKSWKIDDGTLVLKREKTSSK